jgi:hypothetical protein
LRDERFSAQNFGDCPDWLIFDCIEKNEKRKRQEANVNAVTHARGWSGLFNGFAGKDGEKCHPYQLLPFPEDVGEDEKVTISDATLAIFERLYKLGAIHPAVVGAYLSQSKELRKRLGASE